VTQRIKVSVTVLAAATFFAILVCPPSADARRRDEMVFAQSADDAALRGRLAALSPNVSPVEARRVVHSAYTTGRELAREWRVVWPPGLHNFLVNRGSRKGGLCFQFAAELLVRLDALKLQTLELHWGESFPKAMSEHNVIVVTARGQPFERGILLDNWRYGGRLLWGPVGGDLHYEWKENREEIVRRLKRRGIATNPNGRGPGKTPGSSAPPG
jgi:hypothetical protein